jgi:hypothetical protein
MHLQFAYRIRVSIATDEGAKRYTSMVEQVTEKLNAIVGAAVRALVESGADDELIGRFAAQHREKVAGYLGISTAVESPPDLLVLVTQAVSVALENAGIVSKDRGAGPATRRVNVEIAGRRTCVTLSKTVLDSLSAAKTAKGEAKALIEGLANSAPADVPNRSAWVEEHLLLVLSQPPSQTASTRH